MLSIVHVLAVSRKPGCRVDAQKCAWLFRNGYLDSLWEVLKESCVLRDALDVVGGVEPLRSAPPVVPDTASCKCAALIEASVS